MFDKKQKYLEDINKAIDALNSVEMPTDILIHLRESIAQQEILIPMIGDFSVGKSSLLNSFLGDKSNVLPTAITPETSLAAELRFDLNERIEAIKDDAVVHTYALDDFEEIKKHATEYSYIRVFLNNENIKAIQPLVLVDMPGFQSPIEEHNKAINEYLKRGAYFIVLVSATEGSLHRSSFRQINFILECDRDFSVVLSKSNLVSEENLKQIAAKLSEQLEFEVGLNKEPVIVGKDGVVGFKNIINALNPDDLFEKIVAPLFRKVIYDIQSSVNIKLSAIQRTDNDNENAIKQLEIGLEKLSEKQNKLIKEARSTGAINGQVQKIINCVGQELSSNADLLVSIAINQGSDAMAKEISDIVQSVLIVNVRKSVGELTYSITNHLSSELNEVENVFQNYDFDPGFIATFSDNVRNSMENALGALNKMVEERKLVENPSTTYKAITSVLAITTNILNPILELAIVFLPEILGFFKKNMERQRLEEAERERVAKVKTQILTQVIPNVKAQLKPRITEIFSEQAEALVEQITEEYTVLLQNKRAEIDKAREERRLHEEEMEKKIKEIKDVKEIIDTVQKNLF